MSSIDSVIKYMETGEKTGNYNRLFDVVDALEKHNPNFYLRFWEALMEFKTPKMVRSGYIAEMDTDEKNIKIEVVNEPKSTSNSPI